MSSNLDKVFERLESLTPEEFRIRYERAKGSKVTRIMEYVLSMSLSEEDIQWESFHFESDDRIEKPVLGEYTYDSAALSWTSSNCAIQSLHTDDDYGVAA